MATVYDKQGKPVEVPDAQLTQALASGQYGTDKAAVTVKTGDGKVFSGPVANLPTLLAKDPSARVMSDAEVAQHQADLADEANQAKYGGLGSQAKVAAVSGASGLTLGLSDVALGALLTKEQKETLEHEKQANPLTNVGAGIAGALAPALLSGGTAAPEEAALLGGRTLAEGEELASGAGKIRQLLGATGKAVSAPARALDALASGTERGVAGLVGTDAESFVGQLAQKAIAKATGGALSGAAATGAMDIGEDAISPDHNLTGEQLLMHMGLGALMGAGLGTAGAVADTAIGSMLGHAGEAGGPMREALEKKAAELQFAATGAKTKEIRDVIKHGLTTEEVGRWQLDELEKFRAPDGPSLHTREGIQAAAENAMADAGPKIRGHIETLDQVGAVPKWEPILDRLRSEVVEPLEMHIDPAVKGIASRVSGLIDNAEVKLGAQPTFGELFNLRKEIQGAINYSKGDLTQLTANNELRKVRGIVEDEIGKQGKAALGDDWSKGYQDAKRQYQMSVTVRDAAASADRRIQAHEPVSLTSTIIGAHGLGAAALGHPLGLVAGAIGMVGNHLLKTYGNAVGSRLLDGIAKSGILESTVKSGIAARSVVQAQRSYTSAVTRGLVALSRNEAETRGPGRPRTLDSDFDRKAKAVQAMLENPQGHAQSIQANAAALGPSFPTVGGAYQRAAMAASVTLGQALPRGKPVDPLMPKAGKQEPTDAQKASFVRLYDCVDHPPTLLHRAAAGTLTSQDVAAVAATSPAALADIRKQLTAELKTLREPLDPAKQAGVKLLLGQQVMPPPPPPPPPGEKPPKRPLKTSPAETTGLVGSRVGSGT